MKKMKKLSAMLLALALSLALAVPCFAAAPESEDDAIWLEPGETYTIDGVTIELQTADSAAMAIAGAARASRHYYYRNLHWQSSEYFGDDITCKASYGETLMLELDNSDVVDLVMEIWVNRSPEVDPIYCHVNEFSPVSFNKAGGLDDEISWSIYPGQPEVSTYMDYVFSAYQY